MHSPIPINEAEARRPNGLYADRLPTREFAPEWLPDNSLDRKIAAARQEMGEAKWKQLLAEWDQFPAAVEGAK